MPPYIEKRRQKYYAILDIPRDVRGQVGNSPKSKRFVKSLGTDSLSVAERRVGQFISKWKREIEVARTGSSDPVKQDVRFLRSELAKASPYSEEGEFSEQNLMIDMLQEQAEKMDLQSDGSGLEFYKRATGKKIGTTEHIEEWLSSLSDVPKTKDSKRSEVIRFAQQFHTLDTISKRDVKTWCIKLMKTDELQIKTIKKKLSFIRSYWEYLVSIEAVDADYKPFSDLGLNSRSSQAIKSPETEPFKPKDVLLLREEAGRKGDNQLVDLITLAMWSGARIEELCSLKVDQVKDGYFTIEEAKTASGRRNVPIHSKAKPTFDRLLQKSSDGYVLSNLTLNRYGDRSNAIGKRFGRIKEDMGFRPRIESFHSIRKTVASLLQNAQVPEYIAADIIGHEKPNITYGLYAGKNSMEAMTEALEKIDYT